MKSFLLCVMLAMPTAALADPVEHRLSPAAADAAIEAGAERNRAADALALARTDPALALPGEDGATDRKKVHGEVGVGLGSNGEREVFGAVNTSLGNDMTAAFSYDYGQFGRQRVRNR